MKYLNHLPELLPGEHYLSRFSRLLVLHSASDVEKLQLQLSGHTGGLSKANLYQSYAYKLMCELNDDPEIILKEHSLAGFYSQSLKFQIRKTLIRGRRSKKEVEPFIPHLTKLRGNFSWRSCSKCIDEDIDTYGTSYWHIVHQLPTAITCYRHPDRSLISECGECGNCVTDLNKSPVPKHTCVLCSQFLSSKPFKHNEFTRWIQNFGEDLFNDPAPFIRPSFEYTMRFGIGYEFAKILGERSQECWRIQDYYQNSFSQWTKANGLDVYFEPMNEEEFNKFTSLTKVTCYPRKLNPMVHILWHCFFNTFKTRPAENVRELSASY